MYHRSGDKSLDPTTLMRNGVSLSVPCCEEKNKGQPKNKSTPSCCNFCLLLSQVGSWDELVGLLWHSPSNSGQFGYHWSTGLSVFRSPAKSFCLWYLVHVDRVLQSRIGLPTVPLLNITPRIHFKLAQMMMLKIHQRGNTGKPDEWDTALTGAGS